MVDKELLRTYEEKIRSFGTFEQIVELRELFQMVFQNLSLDEKRLTFYVQFFFTENVEYHVDCDLAQGIDLRVETMIKIKSNDKNECISNGLIAVPSSSEKYLFGVEIKPKTPDIDLTDYKKKTGLQNTKNFGKIF